VLEACLPYFKEEFGNPLSIYEYGTRAKNAIEGARERLPVSSTRNPRKSYLPQAALKRITLPLRGIALAKQNEGKHVLVFEDGAPFDPELGQVFSKKAVLLLPISLSTKGGCGPGHR